MTKRGSGHQITRRGVLAGGAAVGTAILLPAQARAQAAQPTMGGTLRVAMPFNPAALDPITGRNLPDFNSLYTLYDALLDFDPDTLELKPMLAKSWEFTDPTTLVLDLVEGVEFHDGTPLNAEAVKFNLDRSMNDARSNVKSDLASVETVEVTGPFKITIKLKKPDAGLPAILSNRAGCMISPDSIKKAADGNVDRTPVGTGPFKFVEWKDNDLIKVEKNTNYWQAGLPYLDGIEFRIINELNTAARSVSSGQNDMALNMSALQIATARRSNDVVAEAKPSLVFYTTSLNYALEPLKDVRVRQAMNYALNREDLNRVLMMGLGEPTSTLFPSTFWAADPETAHFYNHDVDKAKKLLADAGYANGIDIPTWGWPDQASVQRQELFATQFAEAGIRLKVTPVPPAQAMQNFFIDKKGMAMLAPQGGLPDPSQIYERLFAGNALRNAGKIELEGFRPLMDATVSTSDPEERKQAFYALQRYVIEQALHVPQYTSAAMHIQSPKVKDFAFGLITSPKFHRVWMEA